MKIIRKSSRQNLPLFATNCAIIKIDVVGSAAVTGTNQNAVMNILHNNTGKANYSVSSGHEFTSNIKIKTRGSSSSDDSIIKKQYAIGMLNDALAGISKAVLGMPAEEDWVLQANYFDRSQIRNALAYELARNMGYYSSRCVHAEVILNGAYIGTHVFMEKITRNTNRVNIAATSGANLNGGYLFKKDHLDDPADATFGNPATNTTMIMIYPKASNFTTPMHDFIRAKLVEFEAALLSSDFDSDTTGWAQFADRNAFADYVLFTELLKPLDGYTYSAYFNRTASGLLKPFPAWDMDFSLGDGGYYGSELTNNWLFDNSRILGEGLFWPQRMMAGSNFLAIVKSRYATLRSGLFSNANLVALIDSHAEQQKAFGAAIRNNQKWGFLQTKLAAFQSDAPGTYKVEISRMKTFLTSRLSWLDSQLN